MIEHRDVGQLLRGTFGGGGHDPHLDALAAAADAALALAADPRLHPLMRATLTGLYGADNVRRLEAAPRQEPHGAGDELIYEYDPEEQARFEAACAREDAGEDPGA